MIEVYTPDAQVIYQAFVDRLSRAQISRDWSLAVDLYAYPHTEISRDKTVVIKTQDQAEQLFETIITTGLGAGMTDVVRIVKSARFEKDDHIQGTHTVHILRGGSYVIPPYETDMTLRLWGGDWKMTEAQMGLLTPNFADTLPGVPSEH